MVALDAEFNSASNGATFDQSHRPKTSLIPRILHFLRVFPKVIPVRIRSMTCVDSRNGCVGCRIQFCVEWYYFQLGSLRKKKLVMLKVGRRF